VELIILGSSAVYPTSENACSGYLLRDENRHLLIDCGAGVLRQIWQWVDPAYLDAIVISHLHQDHFIDLIPLYYYYWFDRQEVLPKRLIAPKESLEFISNILPEKSRLTLKKVFNHESAEEGKTFQVGDFHLLTKEVLHTARTFGLRVEWQGRNFAYSSDCAFGDGVVEVAKKADFFLCEATLQQPTEVEHLTAEQAGLVAKLAGVKNLILTHIWPSFDVSISVEQARISFGGQVLLAEPKAKFKLG
jgi:ribonuclease BN (tRNA processing enzyme)